MWVSRNGTSRLCPSRRAPTSTRGFAHGRQLAVNITDEESQIWLYDLTRDTLTRFTFDGMSNQYPDVDPRWQADSVSINKQEGTRGIFWKLSDGSGGVERLSIGESMQTRTPGHRMDKRSRSWRQDLREAGYLDATDERSQGAAVRRDRELSRGHPNSPPMGTCWSTFRTNLGAARFTFDPIQVPAANGDLERRRTEPVWNRNGRELFYRSGDKMMAVEISTQPAFAADKPRMLFQAPYLSSPVTFPNYDVSPDGQRFLMLKPVEQAQAAPTQINVVLNWFEELKRLVPTGSK